MTELPRGTGSDGGLRERPAVEVLCKCGHSLSEHPPDPAHPFAWPCRICPCSTYDETGVSS